MTLWVKRLGLAVGLAFIIFACEDPGEIGLGLNPENGIFVAKFNEIPLKTSVIEFDEVVSDNSTRIGANQNFTSGGRILTGSTSNSDFGKSTYTGYTSIYLGASGFKPRESFVFDSITLSVNVNYLNGENFNGIKKIYIHELENEILLDSLYLTKNSNSYLSDTLGEFSFDISGFDTTRVDTVYTTRLADELGMRLLEKAQTDTSVYLSNNSFREFFNGLAFVSDEQNDVVTGVYSESQSTYMRMYFHDEEDTTFFNYIPVGFDTAGYNITRYYNHISLDKTGSSLEGIPGYYQDFETNNDFTYINSGSGIFTKLNMAPYVSFLDTIDHLVINSAELVIETEEYDDYLWPPGGLDLYLTGQDNRFDETYDTLNMTLSYDIVGRMAFSRFSGENKGRYVASLTGYVQSLTSGSSSDTLLLVGASNLWTSVISSEQLIAKKENIYLRVYYSTLQQ